MSDISMRLCAFYLVAQTNPAPPSLSKVVDDVADLYLQTLHAVFPSIHVEFSALRSLCVDFVVDPAIYYAQLNAILETCQPSDLNNLSTLNDDLNTLSECASEYAKYADALTTFFSESPQQ